MNLSNSAIWINVSQHNIENRKINKLQDNKYTYACVCGLHNDTVD